MWYFRSSVLRWWLQNSGEAGHIWRPLYVLWVDTDHDGGGRLPLPILGFDYIEPEADKTYIHAVLILSELLVDCCMFWIERTIYKRKLLIPRLAVSLWARVHSFFYVRWETWFYLNLHVSIHQFNPTFNLKYHPVTSVHYLNPESGHPFSSTEPGCLRSLLWSSRKINMVSKCASHTISWTIHFEIVLDSI